MLTTHISHLVFYYKMPYKKFNEQGLEKLCYDFESGWGCGPSPGLIHLTAFLNQLISEHYCI